MERNHVVIDLDEYNLLRDFKEIILAKNGVNIYRSPFSRREIFFIVDDVKEMLIEENRKLGEELACLKYPKEKSITLDDLKKMSLWGLFKWKISKK